ncbi:C-type lectin domain family 4 member D-like [Epinephelus moara]|nr:C-type lectin domain family 4 member D-like [Epinephelus moara]
MPEFAVSNELTVMMNLIKKEGTLGIRGHTVLCLLIGLLVCGASQAAEQDASAVKLRLHLLEDRYRHLCAQYNALASNVSAPVISCDECPEDWLHVGDQCLYLSTDRDDYVNSTAKCEELGSHLATLTTKEEHDVVEQEARRIGGIYFFYWIGLNDIEHEGDWRWADNSTLETSFWSITDHIIEPDNSQAGGQEGEDCVVVDSHKQVWIDVPCNFAYPRICQKAAAPLK